MRILAVLAEAETTHACLDAATAAARTLGGARIEALHVIVDPKALVTSDEELDIQFLREKYEGTAQERAAAVHRQFASWIAAADNDAAEVRWCSVAGAEETEVVRAAHDADLIVVPHPHDLDGYDALHAALFRTGRPLLLAPGKWPRDVRFPGHVVLYWHGEEYPTPALEAALPWFGAAEKVTVLLVGQAVTHSVWVTQWLDDREIMANVKSTDRHHETLDHCILETAHDLGAGLLVMGPRTHSGIVEWLTGGATHQLVNHIDLPTLLSH